MIERVFIKREGARWHIPGIWQFPDEPYENCPAFLIVHGYMSYKEGDALFQGILADYLAKRGIASLRIDCTSMGENRNDRRNYTYPNLLADVEAGYRNMLNKPGIDHERLGLIGHSLGGKLVCLSAGLKPFCIVTLNGAVTDKPITSNRNNPMFQNKWVDGEYCIVPCSDGRHELLYKAFEESSEGYSVMETLKDYQGQMVVVVGMADPTLPPQTSLEFFEEYQGPHKTIIRIEDANHTFNAKTADNAKVHEMSQKLSDLLARIAAEAKR
ncbi:MAG: alpha/beta hydrolase [Erysipelotrichaceae bacterium]|nr:alpha/beta hydrolase [Erysipelotrichaceae bacterium]